MKFDLDQILDVRGIRGKPARINEIRAMAGRALLNGPHHYLVKELEGPLLDLAVSKAIGLKAVIHLVDNAIDPFFECCVLNESGRLQYQYTPSRNWSQGGPLIHDYNISTFTNGNGSWYTTPVGGITMCSDDPLLSAMRTLVSMKIGDFVQL